MRAMIERKDNMGSWFFSAVGAAVLYGAHQIFTKLASDRIFRWPGWVPCGRVCGVDNFVLAGVAAKTSCAVYSHFFVRA